MHHGRYDNTGATYGQPIPLPPSGYNISNPPNMYEHQPSPYYDPIHPGMNTTEAPQNDRYQNTLPVTQPPNRYPTDHQSIGRIYPPQGPPGSSSVPYVTQSSYPRSSSMDPHSHSTQFIPTPSEIAYTSRIGGPQTSGHSPEQYAGGHDYVRSSVPRSPMRMPVSSGPRPGSGGLSTAASGERFLCEKCGKTFSRSHDRKRHHETQHLPTPVIHRCRFCEKEFSRSDSLKRHVDNGCDEMP